jgi:hypothetical protein
VLSLSIIDKSLSKVRELPPTKAKVPPIRTLNVVDKLKKSSANLSFWDVISILEIFFLLKEELEK